jgi:cobalt/nickel transport system permease protein
MHAHFLDPYRTGSSLMHQLDPRVKLVLAIAFILTTALAPSGAWPVYILLFALLASVEILSELGLKYVLKRSTLALPFILAAVPVMFTMPGPSLTSFALGPWSLTISQPGLERVISVALKSWISVQAAIVLASTTTFPDLLMALRALRVPRLLVSVFGLMWRYLFVLVDEALRMMRARAARSGESGQTGARKGGSLLWRGRVTGGMAGSLFLRGIERSDRIYAAMLSRGYDGEVRALPLPALKSQQIAALVAILFLFVLLLAFAFLIWR